MDYHMQLVERGGAEVNKKSFIRWRDNGIAFRVVEDEINEEDLQTNVTLLSGEGRSAGYWGDITSGPFICLREWKSDYKRRKKAIITLNFRG